MTIRTLIPASLWCLLAIPAHAFPPAPYYQIYGQVRDEQGHPLGAGVGTVILDSFYSALGTAGVSSTGGVTSVTLLNPGRGFSSAPRVSFIGANGSGGGATAKASVTDGVVTGVGITSAGSGYTEPVCVVFSGGGSLPLEIVRSPTSPLGGTNYSLNVPMDSGTISQLHTPTAMKPFLPFTIKVEIGGQSFVPIEIRGALEPFDVGQPAGRQRLDLTLGVDNDRDGLPDSWEEDIVNSLGLGGIADVDPNGDSDGDGVSDRVEYLAGTYAFDPADNFQPRLIDVIKTGTASDENTIAHLQFLSIPGRTYKIKEWNSSGEPIPLKFSTEATATELRSFLFASPDAVYQDVYVPATDGSRQFFVLTVE